MRIVYITRHFNHSGYTILNRLIEKNIKIDAVVLHQDKNLWRNRWLYPFLVSIYYLKCFWYRCETIKNLKREEALAKKHDIPIIYVNSIKDDDAYEKIRNVNPELIVLGGGWHELIPKRIFELPKLGCINTHPSLLPEFRGTSITRWQVLKGTSKSGSVIHFVNDKFDAGGILAFKEIDVDSNTYPQKLFLNLAYAGADIMLELLMNFEKFSKQPVIERIGDERYCNYYPKWSWDDNNLKINWSKSLKEIYFHILANTQESYEYAGPWFIYNNKKIIIRKSKLHQHIPQTEKYFSKDIWIVNIENGSIFLYRQGEEHVLEIVQVQLDDSLRKFRRAFPPSKLNFEIDSIFIRNSK